MMADGTGPGDGAPGTVAAIPEAARRGAGSAGPLSR